MGIGIVKVTREYTEPLSSCQDYHKKIIRTVDEFDDEKYIDLSLLGHAIVIDFREYGRYSDTVETETYENGETNSYNVQFSGLHITENRTYVKTLTFEFSDGTIAKFDCRTEYNKLYKSLKNYIDSEFTDIPCKVKTELEKAADLLADDEFDDI